jgi:radical SAM superfamily enzyme with C-terminal helix-hairpin-helix motif
VGIAERDYMRRNDEPPQIGWEYGLMIVVGAILLIAFSAQHCSNAAKRHLIKGSLILNVNEATAEELQTLPDVGPARAARIIQNRPYQSVDRLFEKRAVPKAVVDANRSLLKTTSKNERTAPHH